VAYDLLYFSVCTSVHPQRGYSLLLLSQFDLKTTGPCVLWSPCPHPAAVSLQCQFHEAIPLPLFRSCRSCIVTAIFSCILLMAYNQQFVKLIHFSSASSLWFCRYTKVSHLSPPPRGRGEKTERIGARRLVACIGSGVELAVPGTGQRLTFSHRGHPKSPPSHCREPYSSVKDNSSHLWWKLLQLQICTAHGYTCQGMDPFLASF